MKIQTNLFKFEYGSLYYWNHPNFLFPQPKASFDNHFKVTAFKQGSEYLYGDNSVRHWKMEGDFNSYIEDEEGKAVHLGQDLETHYSGDSWLQSCTFVYADATLSGFKCYYGQYTTKNRYGEWGYKTNIIHRFETYRKDGEIWCKMSTVDSYAHETAGMDPREYAAFCESLQGWNVWEDYLLFDRQGRASGTNISFSKMAYVATPYLPANTYDWLDKIRRQLDNGEDEVLLDSLIRDTIQEETTLATNNYANILETYNLIRDVASGKWTDCINNAKSYYKDVLRANGSPVDWSYRATSETVKALKKEGRRALRNKSAKYAGDAWLKYRYAYNTTKADVEQAARVIASDKLSPVVPERVLRGHMKTKYGYIHIKMRLHEMTAPSFTSLLINADKLGLCPSLYNLWDMIPYSFVVDWFFPIGDFLEDKSQDMFYHYYRVDELLVTYDYSIERDEGWGHTKYKFYDRQLLDDWPHWTMSADSRASKRTKIMRLTDAVVLSSSDVERALAKRSRSFERARRRLLR